MLECIFYTFLLFQSVYSTITNVGIDGNRFDTTLIFINDSIFYNFHNTNSEIGGAIYINKPASILEYKNLGFIDCSTMNECGAFYLCGQSMTLENICGYKCEAINNRFQFFNLNCENLAENQITMLAVAFCGPQNQGHSAICFSGRTTFRISNINSSYNYNHLDDTSYGACIQSIDAYDFHIFNFNFLHSEGADVLNTHFSQQLPVVASHIMNGNIINCSTSFIFQFRGTNFIGTVYFGSLVYTSQPFAIGDSGAPSSTLGISNCYFDIVPTVTNPQITMQNCLKQSPLVTMQLNQNNFELCQVPVFPSTEFTSSHNFSPSFKFTSSNYFSPSSEFSPSDKFSPSSEFSPSDKFSPSSEFTSSNQFSPSSEFSPSNHFSCSSEFTSSNEFSPSSEFTSSHKFSPSSEFTPSSQFSPSSKFTSSNQFSPSSEFTPSNQFSPSSKFTSSSQFSPSSEFTPSQQFSPSLKLAFSPSFTASSKFTSSTSFSSSSKFTSSNSFSPSSFFSPTSKEILDKQTATFTPSSPFTSSFTFSPEATKYPDGYKRADIEGNKHSEKAATTAQIGATAGLSFVTIAVSVVLMLLYLRNKRKQLREQSFEFSDSLLEDDTQPDDSSYSYSYYTYEEYSVEIKSESENYYCYSDYNEYSTFDGSEICQNNEF